MTRLSISAQFTYKDLPQGYRGLKTNSFIFGRDDPVDIDNMMYKMCLTILDHYLLFTSAKELNEGLERFISNMQMIYVEDVK